jgi:hypothetical protein
MFLTERSPTAKLSKENSPENWRKWLPVTLLLLLAFVPRAYWLIWKTAVLENEGAGYARQAENLLNGKTFEGIVPGVDVVETWLYPVLIAGVTVITKNSETATRIVSLIAGTCLVVPMYFLALRLYGKKEAFVAGGLTAIHPLLVALSVAGYTEGLHLTLMMTAIYWALRLLEPQSGYAWLWAGVFWGLTYLNRTESLGLVAFTVLASVGAALLNGTKLKRAAVSCCKMLLVFAAIAAPYVAFLYANTGQVRFEGKNLVNYTIGMRELAGMPSQQASRGIDADLNEVGPLLDQNRFATYSPYPRAPRDILHYFLAMASRNKYWIYQEVLPSFALGSLILWFLSFFGLFAASWDRERLCREFFLFGVVSYLFLILLAAHAPFPRYTFPLLPTLLLWFSRGVVALFDWGARSASSIQPGHLVRSEHLGLTVAAIPALAILVFSAVGVRDLDELRTGGSEFRPLKEAGLWLRTHPYQPKHIFASAVVAYYSGGSQFLLPYGDSPLALRYIQKKNPDYIVIEPSAARIAPYLRDWLSGGIPDARAELVYEGGNAAVGRIRIFRWIPSGVPGTAPQNSAQPR